MVSGGLLAKLSEKNVTERGVDTRGTTDGVGPI